MTKQALNASIGHLAILAGGVILLVLANPALAQSATFPDLSDPSLTARTIQLIVTLTILSLVPALAIMFTCFPFMVTVLAILRQGIGLQQSPPNMLIITLALFLTYYVMEPVFMQSWSAGIEPYINNEQSLEASAAAAFQPFRDFMIGRVDRDTLEALSNVRDSERNPNTVRADLSLLIPSFLLSEIERAFQIGFIIFLPFLIIDLVVAAILMSMGMMMVPPVMISLPFKLAFFAVADGWSLISSALVRSYF